MGRSTTNQHSMEIYSDVICVVLEGGLTSSNRPASFEMACSNSHTKLVSSTHAFLYAPGCNQARISRVISDFCVTLALKIAFRSTLAPGLQPVP